MAIVTAMSNSFKQELFMALHQFAAAGGNSFYAALFLSTATLNKDTTVYDSLNNESSGVGYTSGGQILAPIDPQLANDVAYVSFANLTWSNSSITARGCQIYNLTNGNRSVSTHLFDSDKTSADGDFTLIFPLAGPDTAVLRLV